MGVSLNKSHNEDIALVLEVSNDITDDELINLEKQINEVGKNLPKGTKISKVYLSRNKLPLANNMKVKRFMVKQAIENNSSEYIPFGQQKEIKCFSGFDKKFLEPIFDKILYY